MDSGTGKTDTPAGLVAFLRVSCTKQKHQTAPKRANPPWAQLDATSDAWFAMRPVSSGPNRLPGVLVRLWNTPKKGPRAVGGARAAPKTSMIPGGKGGEELT